MVALLKGKELTRKVDKWPEAEVVVAAAAVEVEPVVPELRWRMMHPGMRLRDRDCHLDFSLY